MRAPSTSPPCAAWRSGGSKCCPPCGAMECPMMNNCTKTTADNTPPDTRTHHVLTYTVQATTAVGLESPTYGLKSLDVAFRGGRIVRCAVCT